MRHLLPTALALMFLSNAALAEMLGSVHSQSILIQGEILGSDVYKVTSEDYFGDIAAATETNFTPEFNFVVRIESMLSMPVGNDVFPGIYYCRVGNTGERTWTACYDDMPPNG
ncbi:hypothetical protein [Roseobacter sp. HKCC-CH-9208]|uniref:hypothetical protein n=1 Tax=Roseobacter sp. HKCC-CH-9208 TaxID=3120339 RepID=UPI0030EF6BC6